MKKPVIAGSKAGESKPYTPYEAPNDLRSIATARILIALGEGEFAGGITEKDIFLDGTPLMSANGSMNFEGVKWDFRPGTVNQSYIAGFPAVESEIAVGVELKSDTPWTKAINDSQVSAAVIRFRWPALQEMKDNGDVVGYSIQYRIDVSTDGGSFVTVATRSVTGKTNTLYERSTRVDLPAGNTRTIRVTRLTANQNNSRVSDAMFIGAITEVIDRKMRYPNTALLGIQFDASQFSNIPTVSVLAKMRKIRVPDTYDPETRTYSGIWSGAFKMAYSNNPAWVTYDLIVENRFSIGDKVGAQFVDKYELYKIAQYCDQQVPDGKGGTEHRYECNIYIATAAEAWQVLRDLSSIYRGMIYWMQSQMTVRADMPRDVDYVFTNANVIDGTFTYSGSDERVKYTRALVSYDNPDNNYESDVTSTYDNALQRRYGDNVVELSAFGCTRESEAQRRGKWAIYTNNNDRTVSFKTGMEGEIPSLGDIVAIADDLIAGYRIGGRIASVSADGKTITVDKEIAAESGDKLLINLPSGKAESRTVVSSTGKEIRVSTAYSESPAPFLQWTLEKSTLTHQLFQIVSARKADSESIEYEFSGVAYNPSKFDFVDTGARIEDRPVSQIPVGVMEAPEQVTIGQNVYVEQTMAVTVMTIGWSAVKNAVAYEVEWRKDYGEWVKLPRTGQLSIDVKGVYTGQYLARVRAVNSYDVASIPKSSNLTDIVGKTGEPPKLAIFRTASRPFAIFLDWSFGPDSEDALYTEIEYADNALGENAAFLGSYAYPTSDHLMMGLAAGVRFWFRARIKDRTGNLGQWTDWTLGESSVDADEILSYLGGKIGEGELAPGLVDQIKDDVTGDVIADVDGKLDVIRDEISNLETDVDAKLDDINQSFIGSLTGDDENSPEDVLWFSGDDGTQETFVGNVSTTSAYNSEDYAKAKRIALLTARVGDNQAYIGTVDSASVSRDEAISQRVTELNVKVGQNSSMIASEQIARASADEALARSVSALKSTVGDNSASILEEKTARADADGALASRIDALKVEVDGNSAAIINESEVRTGQVSDLNNRVTDDLVNTYGYLTADDDTTEDLFKWFSGDDEDQESNVGNVSTTSASNEKDYTLARQINVVRVKTELSEALITSEQIARVAADEALAQSINALSATVGDNKAAIIAEQTARSDADTALSQLITSLVARVDNNSAAIYMEQQARADEDEALASLISTISAKVDDAEAAIQQTSEALVDLDGSIKANWQVKTQVTADGKVVQAGMGLGASIGADGTVRSEFLVMADTVGFMNKIDGKIHTPFVFDTVNDTVYLSSAIIGDATISFAKIANDIQSTNYQAGVSGWKINKNGGVEFFGGTFRGSLYVEDLIGDVIKPYAYQIAEHLSMNSTKILYTVNVPAASFPRVVLFGSASLVSLGCYLDFMVNGSVVATLSFGSGFSTANTPSWTAGLGAGAAATIQLRVRQMGSNTIDVAASSDLVLVYKA
ncbi:phage tail protein [Vibrio cholerae]